MIESLPQILHHRLHFRRGQKLGRVGRGWSGGQRPQTRLPFDLLQRFIDTIGARQGSAKTLAVGDAHRLRGPRDSQVAVHEQHP